MSQAWVTTSSTHVEAMVNSLTAACDEGFIPDHCYVLENPDVTASVQEATELTTEIVEAYRGGFIPCLFGPRLRPVRSEHSSLTGRRGYSP